MPAIPPPGPVLHARAVKGFDFSSLSPEYLHYSRAHEILSITGAFTAIAVIIVLLRTYVRAVMLRFFGPDDYLMVISTAISVLVFVFFVKETENGLGKHALAMMADMEAYSNFLRWLFIHSIFIMVAISLVKISLAMFLLRLAQRKTHIRVIWGMIVFLIAFTISCAGTLIFQCTPVQGAWDRSIGAKCFDFMTFRNIGLFNSCVNIVTDVVFASLPIPFIWQLQVNTRTKLSLVGILSLGYFACAAAIVKAVMQFTVINEPDWTVHDSFNVWNSIELNVGIMAASLPALKPLFSWFFDAARAMTTSNGQPGTTKHTNGRHMLPSTYAYQRGTNNLGYLKQDDTNVALTSLSSTHMETQTDYVAEVSGPAKEHHGGLLSHHHHRGGGSAGKETVSVGGSSTGKEWDMDARKTSAEGILPEDGCVGIVRTTEVRVEER
ncbi:uncharacterized protein K452DRAFT_311699 [Aplosporella prunicola CBS 121167]|uniref:Rhodopsin domain-containing protein n=1 Tax=Aplosporella prunicola CBS 121167 TaxID=1176127 RepID=A0A6A6B3G0_9PEZI|nr:uncharacterized protein K452DRAFT_311699 [Aplosporella prunicola CBS 121167]KAF2138346.1 hypothetical protein K452DRAFT_311699 [Aplosporella prunicola CBS 121167]